MASNLGTTTIRRAKRGGNALQEFDRMPVELRMWLAAASLPWRPKSVQRAYERALRQTASKDEALKRLCQIESRLIAKDARLVWGEGYPISAR